MLFEVFYCKKGVDICWQNRLSHSPFDCHPEDTACIQAESIGQFPPGTWERKVFQAEKRQISTWSPTLVCPLLPRAPWEIGVTSAIGTANCKRVPVFNRIYLDYGSWNFSSSVEQEMPFPKQSAQWVPPDLAPAAPWPAEEHEASPPLAFLAKEIWQLYLVSKKYPTPKPCFHSLCSS